MSAFFNDMMIRWIASIFLAFWGGYLLTNWLMEPLKKAFVAAGFLRVNYRGQNIPVGMGVSLWGGVFGTMAVLMMMSDVFALSWMQMKDLLAILAVSTGFLVIGLLDDLAGNRDATGLRGHLRQFLRRGEVTTGLLKAGFGVLLGFLGAYLTGAEGWRLLLGGLTVALSANSVNLLDLRPGRACKGVLLALAVLAAVSLRGLESPAFWLLLGATLAYFPEDLRARTMMGDAGSNLLGGAVGMLVVLTCTATTMIVWLGVLILLHLYAEKYSISATIEKNRLLRWLDVLGRQAS
jgi:UDP-N-acetylmuramyl pentapeptide phosphotransferase/UDP-N-acetylglucosamine-1-phosphate transferase